MTKFSASLIWSFLEQGGSKVVTLVVQIVLARILTPEAFGLMAILLVVINVADVLAQSGMGMALIQKTDVDERSYSTAFWLSLCFALILFVLIWLLAPLLAVFYQMPGIDLYIRVLGSVVVLNSVSSIQRSYLQRRMRFDKLFRSNLGSVVVSGAVGIVLAMSGAGIWSLIAQMLVQSLLSVVFMAIFVPWRPSWTFSIPEARLLFDYGWKICITGILNVLDRGITELVMGKACSPSQLGLYSQGRKYPQVAIGVMTNAISNVLFPALSQIKDDKERLAGAVKKILSAGTYVIAPVSLLFVAIAEPVVVILLTEKWLPAVPVFQFSFLMNAFLMFQLANLRAYMAVGDSALYMKINIIKFIIGGGVLCAVVMLTASIYATALAACLVGVAGIFFVDMLPAKSRIGYSSLRQIKDQLPTLVSAFVACGASYAISILDMNVLLTLIIQILVFASVYFALSKLLQLEGMNLLFAALKRGQG